MSFWLRHRSPSPLSIEALASRRSASALLLRHQRLSQTAQPAQKLSMRWGHSPIAEPCWRRRADPSSAVQVASHRLEKSWRSFDFDVFLGTEENTDRSRQVESAAGQHRPGRPVGLSQPETSLWHLHPRHEYPRIPSGRHNELCLNGPKLKNPSLRLSNASGRLPISDAWRNPVCEMT